MTTNTGTLCYKSPEIFNGEYDLTTDVWSLGVLLYIMMVGYPPFTGDEDAIIQKVLAGDFELDNDDWENVAPLCKDLIA